MPGAVLSVTGTSYIYRPVGCASDKYALLQCLLVFALPTENKMQILRSVTIFVFSVSFVESSYTIQSSHCKSCIIWFNYALNIIL